LDRSDALILSYTWDGDQVASITDRAGREVNYHYSGEQLTRVTDVLGHDWTYASGNARRKDVACHSPLGRRFADVASRHPLRLIARTATRAALLKLCPLAHRPSDDLRDLDPLGHLLRIDVR